MESKIILLNEPGKLVVQENQFIKRHKSIVEIAKQKFSQMPVEEQGKVRLAFEERYGSDPKTRTQQQWINLVDTYGLDRVCKNENLSKKIVLGKIKISKSKQMSKR